MDTSQHSPAFNLFQNFVHSRFFAQVAGPQRDAVRLQSYKYDTCKTQNRHRCAPPERRFMTLVTEDFFANHAHNV